MEFLPWEMGILSDQKFSFPWPFLPIGIKGTSRTPSPIYLFSIWERISCNHHHHTQLMRKKNQTNKNKIKRNERQTNIQEHNKTNTPQKKNIKKKTKIKLEQ